MKHYIHVILTLLSICFNFEITPLISEHYATLKYNLTSHTFNITKGNYSTINDGYFLTFNSTKPKQLSFSFLIQTEVNIPSFEACDIRLTSISLDKLKRQNYSTKSKTDIVFFRVKHANKVYLNDMVIENSYGVIPTVERVDYKDHSAKLATAYVIDYKVTKCGLAEFKFLF